MSRRSSSSDIAIIKVVIFACIFPFLMIYYPVKWIIKIISNGIAERRAEREFESIDMSRVDYMDGHDFEHYCAKLIEMYGYRDVVVTKGSGDFGVDIMANKNGLKYAFQCKCYSNVLGSKPVQEAYTGAKKYGADVPVVITNSTFTKHAIELAEDTGVILWDRKKLSEMISREASVNTDDIKWPKLESGEISDQSKSEDLGFDEEQEIAEDKEPLTEDKRKNVSEEEIDKEMSSERNENTLSSGIYRFGKNLPNGTYDLQFIKGEGWLEVYMKNGAESLIRVGTGNSVESSYRGMSNDTVKYFTISGNVSFDIKQSETITIK